MTATALLDELHTKGVHLTVEGERVAVDAPKGVLTDALRQAIRQHKKALRALLAQPANDAAAIAPCTQEAYTHPAPLTPCYPCVVCGSTERWNDHGIWRCVACWPSPERQGWAIATISP